MRHYIRILFLVLALQGCATIDSQQQPPTRSEIVPGRYKALAICVYAELEQRFSAAGGVRFFDYEGMNRARVWHEMTGGFVITPVPTRSLEFVFEQVPQGVRVSFWGRDRAAWVKPAVDDYWPVLVRCADAARAS